MKKLQVKLFGERDLEILEKEINKFIENVKLIDIKYTINDIPRYSALVLYEVPGNETEYDESDELVYS